MANESAQSPAASALPETTRAAPNPRAEATRQLQAARDLVAEALQAGKQGDAPSRVAQLLGSASDRIGSAFHFLRQVQHA
jgi:hypothetical protein